MPFSVVVFAVVMLLLLFAPLLIALFGRNRRKFTVIFLSFVPLLSAALTFIVYEMKYHAPVLLKVVTALLVFYFVGWAASLGIASSRRLQGQPRSGHAPQNNGLRFANVLLYAFSLFALLLPFSADGTEKLTGVECIIALSGENGLLSVITLPLAAIPVVGVLLSAFSRRAASFVFGIAFSGIAVCVLTVFDSFLDYFNQFGAKAALVLYLPIMLLSIAGASRQSAKQRHESSDDDDYPAEEQLDEYGDESYYQ